MYSSLKLLPSVLAKEETQAIPFWFMRQAGRYLPEYKKLRAKHKNFLEFCYTPEAASEATLQPITRFGMSGAIIFSDILVIPDALGAKVNFEEGRGPVLVPTRSEQDLAQLSKQKFRAHLEPVYQALKLTKAALPKDTALIGFAGAPWTIACYMVEGSGSKDFQLVRSTAYRQRDFFTRLIALLTDAVAEHAIEQINAGAEIIQLFDSWSGVLSEAEYAQWVIAPTKKIVAAIKACHPTIPIIGFPRLSGSKITAYIQETGVDAVNIDSSVSLDWARKELQPKLVVQGNLDPIVLAEDKQAMLAQAKHIIATFSEKNTKKNFIFNLGHGILPHTPIENVSALCDLIRNS